MFYTIEPEQRTIHGAFSREIAPALLIDPGDTVRFRTLDADWNLAARESTEREQRPAQFSPRPPGQEHGHPLCGPVAIRGALPGMTLAVSIDAIRPGTYGFTQVGGRPDPLQTRLGIADQGTYLLWKLDPTTLQGRNQYGQMVALRPFMGVMGMPPDQPGLHSTIPPRATGGNIDCKELVVGSTLYLPIAVAGGLFSVGDGHAAQGDGEVAVTAIECPMEQVDLTFRPHEQLSITTPRARTPQGWVTFGFHEDLNEATMIALVAMVDLLGELYGLERRHAVAMASVIVDLRITQIVNRVRGVHALLPQQAIMNAGFQERG